MKTPKEIPMQGLPAGREPSSLQQAVDSRDQAAALAAIRAGADLTEIFNASRWTIAHIAAHFNWVDVLTALQDRRVPLDSKDYFSQQTPLHLAAQSGSVDAIRFLLKTADVEPSPRDRQGQTPFCLAILKGHQAAAVPLIQLGAHTHEYYEGDIPALHYAAYLSWLGLVDVILTKQAHLNVRHEVDLQGNTPLHYAVMAGHVAVAERIIVPNHEALSKVNKAGVTPLDIVLQRKDQALLVLLIDAGAPLSSSRNPNNLLDIALEERWNDVVRSLLRRSEFSLNGSQPKTRQKLFIWLKDNKDPQFNRYYADLLTLDSNLTDTAIHELYRLMLEKRQNVTLEALKASSILHNLERVIGFDVLCKFVDITPSSEQGLELHALSEAARISAELEANQKVFDDYAERSHKKITALREAVAAAPVSGSSLIVNALQIQRRDWPFNGNTSDPGKRPSSLQQYFTSEGPKKRTFGLFF